MLSHVAGEASSVSAVPCSAVPRCLLTNHASRPTAASAAHVASLPPLQEPQGALSSERRARHLSEVCSLSRHSALGVTDACIRAGDALASRVSVPGPSRARGPNAHAPRPRASLTSKRSWMVL